VKRCPRSHRAPRAPRCVATAIDTQVLWKKGSEVVEQERAVGATNVELGPVDARAVAAVRAVLPSSAGVVATALGQGRVLLRAGATGACLAMKPHIGCQTQTVV
jgi:hypothetical protein